MLQSTRNIIRAALDADATVPETTTAKALCLLDGTEQPPPLGRVIRTAEARRLLGVTSKTLRLWALRGALVPVFGGQTKRRTGYTEASVRAILAGPPKGTSALGESPRVEFCGRSVN